MKSTNFFRFILCLGLLVTAGYSTEVFAQTDWRITGNTRTDSSTNFLGTKDTEDLVIRTDNTERIRVNGRGRVGIGTDDPRQLLDVEIVDNVKDSVSYPARLSHVTKGIPQEGFGTGLEFQISGARGRDATLGTIESVLTDATVGAEESALHFKTTDIGDDGLVSRMSINKDGNVTIGGTLSSAKLNVTGDEGQAILSLRRHSAGFVLPSAVIVNSDGQVGINNSAPSANLHVGGPASDGTRTTIAKIGNPSASLFFDGDDIDSWRDILADNLFPIPLHINRFSSGNVVLANGGGNVGVGTTSPNTRLHITDGTDASLSGGGFLTTGSTGGTNIVIDSNEIMARNGMDSSVLHLQAEGGAVEIGAQAENGRLLVTGPDNNGELAAVEIHSGNQQLLLDGNEIDSLNDSLFLNHNSDEDVVMATRTNANSRVGIGTTNPEARLHVQGNADTDILIRDEQLARMDMVATNSATDVELTIQARGSDDGVTQAEIGTVSNHDVAFFAAGATRLVIASDGNVCIGNC